MVISVMRNEEGMLTPNPNAKVRELSSEDRKTVFAGDLTKKTNSVSQVRERAQKKAQKLIKDVFDSEKEMEETLQKMRDKRDGFVDERVTLLKQVQQDMLEKDEVSQVYLDRIHEAEQGIASINSSLRGIQIERLKKHPMIDAQKNAQDILMQASKEIIGELRNEAVDHIQEKLDEVVEKAQEEAAKKEEDDEVQEVVSAYQGKRSKADQELKKMMDNLELILEDIKGAEVDVNL